MPKSDLIGLAVQIGMAALILTLFAALIVFLIRQWIL